MFSGLVKAIKTVGKCKAMLEAIDDDIDLDGVRELDELKDVFESILGLGKSLITELKRGYTIAAHLVEHVAKAGEK